MQIPAQLFYTGIKDLCGDSLEVAASILGEANHKGTAVKNGIFSRNSFELPSILCCLNQTCNADPPGQIIIADLTCSFLAPLLFKCGIS
jgi:hypothetical protein